MKIGKAPENVLKRSVLRQIKTKREEITGGAGIGRDCATFLFSGDQPFMTCMQEAEVSVSPAAGGAPLPACGEAGWERCPLPGMAELIQRCANNLAAGGGRMVSVLICLILPADTEEPLIRALMAEAERKCAELSVGIAGGQTRISGAATAPIAVVTGYGRPFAALGTKEVLPGQDVVLSKWIGLEGTAVLAKRNRAGLLARYPAYLVREAEGFGRYLDVTPEAGIAAEFGAGAMHDASEGGIFGALWELAEGAGVGLTIDLKKLPLRQETVEVCEFCKVNPYELLSGGCLVVITEDGPGLAAALRKERIPAAVVGRVTDGSDRILINGDEVRYMDRPKNDEVYRC